MGEAVVAEISLMPCCEPYPATKPQQAGRHSQMNRQSPWLVARVITRSRRAAISFLDTPRLGSVLRPDAKMVGILMCKLAYFPIYFNCVLYGEICSPSEHKSGSHRGLK